MASNTSRSPSRPPAHRQPDDQNCQNDNYKNFTGAHEEERCYHGYDLYNFAIQEVKNRRAKISLAKFLSRVRRYPDLQRLNRRKLPITAAPAGHKLARHKGAIGRIESYRFAPFADLMKAALFFIF